MTNCILHHPESKVQGHDETWGQCKGESLFSFRKDDWLKDGFRKTFIYAGNLFDRRMPRIQGRCPHVTGRAREERLKNKDACQGRRVLFSASSKFDANM